MLKKERCDDTREQCQRVMARLVSLGGNDNSSPLRVTRPEGRDVLFRATEMDADTLSTTCRDQCLLPVYQQDTPKNA